MTNRHVLMGKSEANSEEVRGRINDSGASETAVTTLESPDNQSTGDPKPCLDDLLPFLEERIVFKMPSEIRHMDGVLYYLNERMLKLGIVRSEDSEVLIALDEAIVNAIKHGNKCDPRKAVHIVAEFSSDGARFTISDEGAGFVREDVPDPRDPCRLLEPNGRGLLLINHIMDEVCFNQSGNQLEMFKRSTDKSD